MLCISPLLTTEYYWTHPSHSKGHIVVGLLAMCLEPSLDGIVFMLLVELGSMSAPRAPMLCRVCESRLICAATAK